jgi:hypothetical protein
MSTCTEIIQKIEALRKSRVIAYITSDRNPPVNAQIHPDTIPYFYEQLKGIGKVSKIDLYIYSLGGDIMAPWRLVNLIREYCDKFSVLIPYKAHSAATLIALGADEIVMCPLGELSPIDPSIGTPFNPPHPDNPNEQKVPIGVEDVFGYINLAKDKMGIKNPSDMVRVLDKLVERIHPLAIGGIYRSHALIRLLAKNLLSLHMKGKEDGSKADKMADYLAEKLYYHSYLISRAEAPQLGLKVINPDSDLENLMWDLFVAYKQELNLGEPFDPIKLLPQDKAENTVVQPLALVENSRQRFICSKELRIFKIPQPSPNPPGIGIQERVLGWQEVSKENK